MPLPSASAIFSFVPSSKVMIAESIKIHQAEDIADTIVTPYVKGVYERAELFYTEYVSPITQQAVTKPLKHKGCPPKTAYFSTTGMLVLLKTNGFAKLAFFVFWIKNLLFFAIKLFCGFSHSAPVFRGFQLRKIYYFLLNFFASTFLFTFFW